MAPVPSTPVIQEINSDGFKILAGAIESTSGIKGIKVTANGTELPADKIEVNKITAGGITFTIIGLDEDQPYNIDIVIIDNAGNESVSTATISESTVPAIDPPVITVLSNNTWAQTKTAQIEGVEGYTIRYTLNGTIPNATKGTQLTGVGTKNVTMDRENCKVRAVYVNNKTGKASDVGISEEGRIDRTGPVIEITGITINKNSTATVEWSLTDEKSGPNNDTTTVTVR